MSAPVSSFHGSLMAHPERASDSGPGVPSLAGLGDEFSPASGHATHPLLERGESIEDVIGHDQTVTRVADASQVCNYSCMTKRPACDLTLTHPRLGLMDVLKTDDGRYENWSYSQPRTLAEWSRLGWIRPPSASAHATHEEHIGEPNQEGKPRE